jgi:hypothetical protein
VCRALTLVRAGSVGRKMSTRMLLLLALLCGLAILVAFTVQVLMIG